MKKFATIVILYFLYISSAFSQDMKNVSIPARNQQVIDTTITYGAKISPTYQKAVCTEFVIKIVGKFYPLTKTDKSRIRIITGKDIQELLTQDSPTPKGIYYALAAKGIGEPIDSIRNVQSGDFVQFWTTTWGHCGIVKEVDIKNSSMDLYSSFPSTNGYGYSDFLFPITVSL